MKWWKTHYEELFSKSAVIFAPAAKIPLALIPMAIASLGAKPIGIPRHFLE